MVESIDGLYKTQSIQAENILRLRALHFTFSCGTGVFIKMGLN